MTSDLLLLLTAIIWGFAFVAQRAGMTHMGPFTFNAVRFLLGGLALAGIACIFKAQFLSGKKPSKAAWIGAILTGIILFTGASLQQVGLVGTTAGKAGFITGLYVVFVPFLGLFIRTKTSRFNWIGAIFAVVGLFFLSVREDFSIAPYDLIVLVGAIIWAVHVLMVGHLAPMVGPVRLAIIQFLICGILSLLTAIIFENPNWISLKQGWLSLAYGSFLSVGLAYTLQVVAQRKAHPSHAAIILSFESLFAAIGGWLILSEKMDLRGFIGAGLMLSGMLFSQVHATTKKDNDSAKFSS